MKKAIFLGCGIIALLALVIGIAVVAFFVHVSKDVEGVAIYAENSPDVIVGQTFELEIVVTNERPQKVIELSDLDVAESYLSGFTLLGTEPRAKSSQHVPISDSRSFHFEMRIPPHSAQSFKLKLRAEKAGSFSGDVDACEGARFITCLAQTIVKEK